MVEPARMLARLTLRRDSPPGSTDSRTSRRSLRGKVAGALHATEIPFVFNTERVEVPASHDRGRRSDRTGDERVLGRVREDG